MDSWGIPYTQTGGVTLIERRYAAACATQIVRSGARFYGYDAFAVDADAIQPFLEFSPDWSRGRIPELGVVLSEFESHPSQITHYEFVFDPP